jgi:hypothetical protein
VCLGCDSLKFPYKPHTELWLCHLGVGYREHESSGQVLAVGGKVIGGSQLTARLAGLMLPGKNPCERCVSRQLHIAHTLLLCFAERLARERGGFIVASLL